MSSLTSIRLSEETRDKIMVLKEELKLKSWAMVMKQGVDLLFNQRNNKHVADKASNEGMVIDAKSDEKLTGDLAGTYTKEKKKLKGIDKAENDGMPKELAEAIRLNTRKNYGKSREALIREFKRKTEGSLEWHKEQIKAAGKPKEELKPAELPKKPISQLFVFKHCGRKWSKSYPGRTYMLNAVCPTCKKLVTSMKATIKEAS